MSPIPEKYCIPTSSEFILFQYDLNHLFSSDLLSGRKRTKHILSGFGHEVCCEVMIKPTCKA